MKTRLLLGMLVLACMLIAAPALAGRPADAPADAPGVHSAAASVASQDGALSERWFAFKTDRDIVDIARQELVANELVDENVGYGKELKGAYALAPVFVESLDDQYPSYYMVSFMGKGQKISVLCIVGVKDGKATLKEVYGLNPQITTAVYPAVVESEAKAIATKAVASKALAVGPSTALSAASKGKLVFKFSAECGGPAMPAWDFGGGVRVSQTGAAFSDFTPESKIKKQ